MSRIEEQETMLGMGQEERPQVSAQARNMSPIVPRTTIHGRALVAVVAIMTFLASMTTGIVLMVNGSADEWQSEVASEITVQIRPQTGRDTEQDLAAALETVRTEPGIASVQAMTRDESGKLLEPWLGKGLSMDDLPVPRMVIAKVEPGTALNLAELNERVTTAVPTASVDDHRAWIDRMRSMTRAIVLAGLGILALVIMATIISVSFAASGAVAASRPIVEVLHFVGAGDRYIANQLLRHFLRLGLQGGLIGGLSAILVFGFSESIANWFSGTPVGDQFAAMLGTFSLKVVGYLAVAVQAVVIGGIAAVASRQTLFSTLNDID
ncbi:MAG: ABC transporter permease [Alphaproteobacteria bacterium]|nr:ABC transporter permease [Alphaproteobacteria bacterium]